MRRGTFEEETKTIRTWLNYGAVSVDRLVAELTEWADYFAEPVDDRLVVIGDEVTP